MKIRQQIRRLLPLFAVALCTLSAAAQQRTAAGRWTGGISTPGVELRVIVNLQQKDDRSWTGTIDIPMQNANGLPLTNIASETASISFSIAGLPGNPTFNGTLSEDGNTISGDFTQGPAKFAFKLARNQTGQAVRPNRPQEPQKPYPYDEREVTYENKNGGVKLAGTLTLPRSAPPFPAVILITGSGPQDRDETVAGHKPFLILADHLTRRGLAVLRIDDRGVGASTGSDSNSTADDLAGDVLTGLEFLKSLPEIDSKRIGLIGHSEGGIVAPLVATKSNELAFIVLMAGPGLPGDQGLYLQSSALLRASGMGDAQIAENRKAQEAIFNVVKSEKNPTARSTQFRTLRDQLTANLPDDAKTMMIQRLDADFQRVSTPSISYLLSFDPRPVLAKVKSPVLAVNGEKDLQVPYLENLAAIEDALKSGGNKDYAVVHLPNLNHLFQTSKTGLPAEYGQIEETMAPQALEVISEWIEKRVRR